MDEKNNYDSDISESWSLIDINLNEESLTALETSIESEKNSESEFKNEKSNKTNVTELEDFVRKCKEINQTDFAQVSDSDSDCSFNNQGLPTVSRSEPHEIDSFLEKSSGNDGKRDSADTESIEILDVDASSQDSEVEKLDVSHIDHYDFTTYQSDDEESLTGNEGNRSNNSAVIKRRRRSRKSTEESMHSVNSENPRSLSDNNSTVRSSDRKSATSNGEEGVNTQTVYKHTRNNAANTILSFSVGFFFAGVAGIAIGYYLGVRYTAENTWQKQVENVALESPLSHSGKGLPSQETNSELELPLNEPGSKLPCGQNPSKNDETGLKESDIRSSLDSMEWLSKLEDLVLKNKKVTDTQYRGLDLASTEDVHPLEKRVKDSEREILKLVQKIHNWMSTSQDRMQKLGEGLIKLKNILNLSERGHGRSKRRRRVPVTELDLQSINWNTREISKRDSESMTLYEFPKPESYYQETRNSSRVSKHSEANEKKNKKKCTKKKEDKRKENWKRKKSEENETKKKRKRVGNVEKMVEKNKRRLTKERLITLTENLNYLYETMNRKKKNEGEKRKGKTKKAKNPKRVWLSEPKNRAAFKRKNYSRKFSGPELFNLTGYWVFKWADGRDEIRKHEALGEWQFERAKARKELRDDHFEENWQFKRALAREMERWPQGKYGKYVGKIYAR